MGSSLRAESKLFQAIVVNDTPVYLALDADAKKKRNYIISLFDKYDVELKIIDTSHCEDVGSMTPAEFCNRKDQAWVPDLDEIFFFDKIKSI